MDILVINPGAIRITDSYDGTYGTIQIYSGKTWCKLCWDAIYDLDKKAHRKLGNSIAKAIGQTYCELRLFFDDLRPTIEPYISIPYICVDDGDIEVLSKCLHWQKRMLTLNCASHNSINVICSGIIE